MTIILNVLTRDPQFIDGLVKRIRNHPDVTDTYTMHVLYGQGEPLTRKKMSDKAEKIWKNDIGNQLPVIKSRINPKKSRIM